MMIDQSTALPTSMIDQSTAPSILMMIDQSTAPPSILMMTATLADVVDTTTDTLLLLPVRPTMLAISLGDYISAAPP
jgi:hypothetical protein